MKPLDPSPNTLLAPVPREAVQATDFTAVLLRLAGILASLRHVIMWASIGLVFLVGGAYAVLVPDPGHPGYRIVPDPDMHPIPAPAPTAPLPADPEMIFGRR